MDPHHEDSLSVDPNNKDLFMLDPSNKDSHMVDTNNEGFRIVDQNNMESFAPPLYRAEDDSIIFDDLLCGCASACVCVTN